MTGKNRSDESPGATLCKSCGLCCTGHLFIWAKLRSAELDNVQALGVKVFREPGQRGFSQPCPLWDGVCTIHESPQYPRFCRTYKCKLLKQVLDDVLPLPSALSVVQQTKSLIHELDMLLPTHPSPSFRERLVAYLELGGAEPEILQKARELLDVYESQFGVTDLLLNPPANT